MITILYPTALAAISEISSGLLPFRHQITGKLLLVIKASKEVILTARLKQGFRFYVAPLLSTSGLTVALVTAFFDDDDEPLVIATPLFDEPLTYELLELLSYDELDVYFFDELNREWMGCRATIEDRSSILVTGESFGYLTYHPGTVESLYEVLQCWFGNRTKEDDANAIEVRFAKELYPSDYFILDATDETNDYHGSGGYSRTSLERDVNPGDFQERDVVACLKRAFPGDQVSLNPFRRDTGKELTDVFAVSESSVFLVQAKDSPNTAASLSRTISRKRKTTHGQIEKAIAQVKGALSYARGRRTLELLVSDKPYDVNIEGKTILCLVVVKEMFEDEGDLYIEKYRSMDSQCDAFVLLDYPALHDFCHEFSCVDLLQEALEGYSQKIIDGGVWIDPRNYALNFRQSRLNGLR